MTLLTTDDYRGLKPGSAEGLDDTALQLLLDASEEEILRYAGPTSAVSELHEIGGRLIALRRRASSISSITETSYPSHDVVTLATDDYYFRPDGYTIERLSGGTNSRYRWHDRVTVTYDPEDDVNIRKGVQADLINLMINYSPGLTSETVGAWTRQIASNSAWNEAEERAAILSRLTTGGRMAIAS